VFADGRLAGIVAPADISRALERISGNRAERSLVRLGSGWTARGRYPPLIRLSWPAHSRSRRMNFWIFPVEVFGSGPNAIASGHL
jgi:hypothetical protein